MYQAVSEQEIFEWYGTLDEAEQLAVDYWLTTGNPVLINEYMHLSEKLRLFQYLPILNHASETGF